MVMFTPKSVTDVPDRNAHKSSLLVTAPTATPLPLTATLYPDRREVP